jgi:aquaporin Z
MRLPRLLLQKILAPQPFDRHRHQSAVTMRDAIKHHWPEYLMEAAALGLFMISACSFATLLGRVIPDNFLRRVVMGAAMGLTAIGIIYSPWGKQSGAHMNPSVTLTFLRLGKVKPWDALFYIVAQFAGGVAGVAVAAALVPHVNYANTVPGTHGAGIAFVAELIISFILMSAVLRLAGARATGIVAGILVATFITLEDPFSGMSMNPARTFGSALPANVWTSLWVYFTAPPLGMLLAAQLYRRRAGCAKLHHQNNRRCIHCGFGMNQPTPTKGEAVCIAR